jgi:hypothetical protein
MSADHNPSSPSIIGNFQEEVRAIVAADEDGDQYIQMQRRRDLTVGWENKPGLSAYELQKILIKILTDQ